MGICGACVALAVFMGQLDFAVDGGGGGAEEEDEVAAGGGAVVWEPHPKLSLSPVEVLFSMI